MVPVWFPYRSTLMGGFDYVYVFSSDGTLIKPTRKERSRTGRHGDDIYELSNGVYYATWFSRPNGHNRPIYVRYIRLVVDGDNATRSEISESDLPQAVAVKARAIYNRLIG